MEKYHIPVMLKESLEGLNLKPGGIYVDATLGGAGHSLAILQSCPDIQLYSFDQDEDALNHVRKKLGDTYPGLHLIHDNFSDLWTRLSLERIKKIDGILFDLGVSSHQIDKDERGFSFSMEADLDMRMDRSNARTAYDVVNNCSLAELRSMFFEYGEERESSRIARAIVEERDKKEIKTTEELARIIDYSTKSHQKMKAKARIFQAIRIYLNDEINVLKKALSDAIPVLRSGGRIVVISYHSLEDRVVKQIFKYAALDCICPPGFPQCICGKQSTLKIITRKPLLPTEDEIAENSRARSAKMRIAERKEVL